MIYFVRHGSTDWNENINSQGIKEPKCQGRVDLNLNEKGISQAKQTAEQLKNINFDRIICSPLKRAKQTLDIIYTGNTPIEIDERIIERDFGEFEGLTRAEFDFNGFWNINSNQKFKKAESIKDVENRVFSLLNELKENPNKNVLIVSHGGVGCVLMSYFKGVPQDGNYLSFEIPNGQPLILDFEKSMEKVGLSKFVKADAEFIQKNFPTYFRDNSIENIERIIELWQDALCFCITYNGEKVGIITLSEKQERKLSWGVMVKEEYRGRGIATRAFELIKAKAKERGYTTIISSCSTDNIASKRLHEKVGFLLYKTEVNQGGFEMYRWQMEI